MINFIFLILFQLILNNYSSGQKIYISKDIEKSDIIVYMCLNENDADCIASMTMNKNEAKRLKLFFVENEDEADIKFYIINDKSKADLKIYMSKYLSDRRWKNMEKKVKYLFLFQKKIN